MELLRYTRYMRVLLKSSLAAAVLAAWAGTAVLAAPAPVPVPATLPAAKASASPSAAAADEALPSKDGGTVDGRISRIDYHSGVMTVDVGDGGGRKSIDILVVPGTNIQGQKDFHTIADLKKGAHVQVLISRHGTTNTAQIIRLL